MTKEKLLKKLERIECMEALRSQGKTYEEIAKAFGVSKQRVFQLIGDADENRFVWITEERCVYSGLRNYMNEKKLSVAHLTRLVYGERHPKHYQAIKSALNGANCTKQTIDNILKVTGLSYEAAFGRSDTE